MQSKYCYPNSDVLINKLNIRDEKELEIAERRITTVKIAQLYEKPITGNFDMKHLQAIHKHIFQDIYPFAGKLRDEQIAKGYFQFASPLYFTDMFKDLHNQLKKEKFLNGMDKENISKRLAYYMAEINVIHPFREGNGRSTREYIRFLAMSNGYTIDWSKIDRNELLNASVRSTINTDKLEQLIYNSIKENEPSKEIMRKWKNAELEEGLEL